MIKRVTIKIMSAAMGGDLGGYCGGQSPQNLSWGMAHAYALQYFENHCFQSKYEMTKNEEKGSEED